MALGKKDIGRAYYINYLYYYVYIGSILLLRIFLFIQNITLKTLFYFQQVNNTYFKRYRK